MDNSKIFKLDENGNVCLFDKLRVITENKPTSDNILLDVRNGIFVNGVKITGGGFDPNTGIHMVSPDNSLDIKLTLDNDLTITKNPGGIPGPGSVANVYGRDGMTLGSQTLDEPKLAVILGVPERTDLLERQTKDLLKLTTDHEARLINHETRIITLEAGSPEPSSLEPRVTALEGITEGLDTRVEVLEVDLSARLNTVEKREDGIGVRTLLTETGLSIIGTDVENLSARVTILEEIVPSDLTTRLKMDEDKIAVLEGRVDNLDKVERDLDSRVTTIDVSITTINSNVDIVHTDLEDLKPRMKVVEDDLSKQSGDITGLDVRVSALEKSGPIDPTIELRLEAVENSVKTALDDIEDLKPRLKITEDDLSKQSEDIAGIDGRVSIVQGDLKFTQDSLFIVQADLKIAKDGLLVTKEDLEDLKPHVKDVEDGLLKQSVDIAGIDDRVNVVQGDVVDLKSRMNDVENNLLEQSGKVIKLDDRVDIVQTDLKTTQGDLEDLKPRMKDVEDRVTALEQEIPTDVEPRLKAVEGDVSTLKTSVDVVDSEIKVVKDDLSVVESDVLGLKTRINVIEGDVSTLKTGEADIVIRVTALEQEIPTDVEPRLKAIESDVSTLKTGEADIVIRVTALEQEIPTDVEPRLKAVEGDVSTLKTRVDVVKDDLSVVESEVDGAKKDISAVKIEVDDVKTDISVLKTDVEEEISGLKIDIGMMGNSVETINTRLKTQESLIADKIEPGITALEQDLRTDIEPRLGNLEAFKVNVEPRLETIEGDVVDHNKRITVLETVHLEPRLEAIEGDVVDHNKRITVLETVHLDLEPRVEILEARRLVPDYVGDSSLGFDTGKVDSDFVKKSIDVSSKFSNFIDHAPSIESKILHYNPTSGSIQYGGLTVPSYIKPDMIEFEGDKAPDVTIDGIFFGVRLPGNTCVTSNVIRAGEGGKSIVMDVSSNVPQLSIGDTTSNDYIHITTSYLEFQSSETGNINIGLDELEDLKELASAVTGTFNKTTQKMLAVNPVGKQKYILVDPPEGGSVPAYVGPGGLLFQNGTILGPGGFVLQGGTSVDPKGLSFHGGTALGPANLVFRNGDQILEFGVEGLKITQPYTTGGYSFLKTRVCDPLSMCPSFPDAYFHEEKEVFGTTPSTPKLKYSFDLNDKETNFVEILKNSPRTTIILDFSKNPIKLYTEDIYIPSIFGVGFNIIDDRKPIYSVTISQNDPDLFNNHGFFINGIEPVQSKVPLFYDRINSIPTGYVWTVGAVLTMTKIGAKNDFSGKIIFTYLGSGI